MKIENNIEITNVYEVKEKISIFGILFRIFLIYICLIFIGIL